MIKTPNRQGFTLIEILIVVAIIAILASVVLVGLGPTQQAGRDARRISDLASIQQGLELYYGKCGYYPGTLTSGTCSGALPSAASYPASAGSSVYGGVAAELTASTAGLGLSTMPNDPSSGKTYRYTANAASSPTSYILGATLENANNSVFTTYTPPANFVSSNGDTYSCTAPDYCITL